MKLMQLLMGLDNSYMQLRSNILAREPLLDDEDAYTLISNEESHKVVVIGLGDGTSQMSQSFVFNSSVNNRGNLVLTDFLTLYDVLVVPEYSVTLVSVHKVAKDSKLIVGFVESKCFVMSQDLMD
ncbi:hypothetical protein Tco_0556660, partial [Tanacetum coccineum]